KRALSFARISGTQSRLIVSIDEAKVTAAINREIRTAYLQLGFVCLFVLLGALVGAEKLIINPIEVMTGMARRFGEGDWSARVARSKLPSEFMPLARAFNAMAAQLSQRPRRRRARDRHPAPGRPQRSPRRRPLRRQTPRPQHRGPAWLRADGARSRNGAGGVASLPRRGAGPENPKARKRPHAQ